MNSLLPQTSEPIGAPKSSDTQNIHLSAYCAISFASTLSACAALKIRAPCQAGDRTHRPSQRSQFEVNGHLLREGLYAAPGKKASPSPAPISGDRSGEIRFDFVQRLSPAFAEFRHDFVQRLSPAFAEFRLGFVRHLLHLLDEFRLGFVHPLSPFPDEFRLDFVQRSPLPSTNSDLVSCTHASLFQLISDLVSCRLLSISCRNRNAFPQKLT